MRAHQRVNGQRGGFAQIRSLCGTAMQRDPERSKAALIEAIGRQIVLRPDESRRFLWAEYGLEEQRLVAAVGMPEIMVAGA